MKDKKIKTIKLYLKHMSKRDLTKTETYYKTVKKNLFGRIYIYFLRRKYNLVLRGRGSRIGITNYMRDLKYDNPNCKKVAIYFRIDKSLIEKHWLLVDKHFKDNKNYWYKKYVVAEKELNEIKQNNIAIRQSPENKHIVI